MEAPGGDPQPATLKTVKVLGLALCTGLGDPPGAATGARWSAERRLAGLIWTPKREMGAQ